MVSSSSSKNSGASSAAASAAASDNPSSLNYFLTALLTIAVLYYRIYLPSSSSPTSFFFFSSSPSSSTLINSRSQVFLTWVNASSARCCNITIPSTITILSSPGISHPRSASHFDTQENGGSAPRSKYGTGRSVFENLYGKIVLPAVDSEPGWGEKGRITSGGQRGLYYDRRGFGPTDRGGTVEEPYLAGEGFQDCPSSTDNQGSGPEPSPPPVLVVPAPLHVTRTVALKSIYGAALQYLSPPSQFDRDIHVPKFLAHYPPPSVPSIPGRLTNSAPTPRLTIPSSKLTRPLALANLTPSLAALADPIILALFLARERYIGEASRFAPWIQSMQGVNDGVSWEFIAEKTKRYAEKWVLPSSAPWPSAEYLRSASSPPPSYCGSHHSPSLLDGFSTEGWADEQVMSREYVQTVARTLAADYGWIVTAPASLSGESAPSSGSFFDLFLSEKDKRAKNHEKKNRAQPAHREDNRHKYKFDAPSDQGGSSSDVRMVAGLMEWALCTVSSRGVGSAGHEGRIGQDVYFGAAAAALDDDEASGEAVFSKQVEELVENEYRFIDHALRVKVNNPDGSKSNPPPVSHMKLIPLVDFINHGRGKPLVEESERYGPEREGAAKVYLEETVRASGEGEITMDYNMAGMSGLDWYLAMGFVPLERAGRWDKGANILQRTQQVRADFVKMGGPQAAIILGNEESSLEVERARSLAWRKTRGENGVQKK